MSVTPKLREIKGIAYGDIVAESREVVVGSEHGHFADPRQADKSLGRFDWTDTSLSPSRLTIV